MERVTLFRRTRPRYTLSAHISKSLFAGSGRFSQITSHIIVLCNKFYNTLSNNYFIGRLPDTCPSVLWGWSREVLWGASVGISSGFSLNLLPNDFIYWYVLSLQLPGSESLPYDRKSRQSEVYRCYVYVKCLTRNISYSCSSMCTPAFLQWAVWSWCSHWCPWEWERWYTMKNRYWYTSIIWIYFTCSYISEWDPIDLQTSSAYHETTFTS